MLDSIKSEFVSLASTRIAWFLAGVYISGQDIPAVFNSLKTFVGL